MKRFAFSVFAVSMLFVGLGNLAEHVGARFKSDEKALDIVRRARTAIGGEAALAEVRSFVVNGRSLHTVKVGDAERSEPGETEIALQFPDKLSRRIKIGNGDGIASKTVSEQHDVLVVTKGDAAKVRLQSGEAGEFTTSDGNKIVIRERVGGEGRVITDGDKKIIIREINDDNTANGTISFKVKEPGAAAGEKHEVFARTAHGGVRQNELLRLSLALLLTAPEGINVDYTFAGEGDIDGTPVNIVNAEFAGSNYKLYISKASSLPVAMGYTGMPTPKVVRFTRGDAPVAGDATVREMTFARKVAADVQPVDYLVKFSDYRSTGSVQLPYKWTTTVAGATTEVFDVTSYDINPANIAERFPEHKVFVRTKKADGQ